MRLRDSYRVPLLLLSCVVTALMFPRACAETRVGLGALLPATAPLTAVQSRDDGAALREEIARLSYENGRLLEEREALPSADGPLSGARVERPAARPFVLVAARVRHRDASPSRRSFSIDVGRADGVGVGMPVACGDSIVGLVTAVTDHSALVVRIDDPTVASTVPAAIVGSGAAAAAAPRPSGTSRGTGDGETAVSFLRQGDAKPGDMAVTGVGEALVPEGLVLGEVVAFGDDDRDGSYEAEVRPLRDLDTLNSVVVVRAEGGSGPSLLSGRRR